MVCRPDAIAKLQGRDGRLNSPLSDHDVLMHAGHLPNVARSFITKDLATSFGLPEELISPFIFTFLSTYHR